MFKTIVWATDGSETAGRALPYAKGLAEGPDKTLVVVHVKELLAGRGGGYPIYADEAELLEKIEAQVEEIRESGIVAELKLATSTTHGPAHFVAEVAKEVRADVIVVGTRGHGPLAGALLGSVAQHLLHDAPCPVLAVPPLKAAEAPETERETLERRPAPFAGNPQRASVRSPMLGSVPDERVPASERRSYESARV